MNTNINNDDNFNSRKNLLNEKEKVNLQISSRPKVFLRKSVLKICSKFTGEHPCQIAISIKLQSI